MENNHNRNQDIPISEILQPFRLSDGEYKREAVDAAIARKDEITPHLIRILEDILADPFAHAENLDFYDHIYAVMLLGHFKEPRAHKLIVDIFSLPDGLSYQLFGDIGTENLPMILFNTCGGSLEHIKDMVLNRAVDEYYRVSASLAMTYAVHEGYADRKETVEFFGSLFTGNDDDEEDSDFFGLLAANACHLYPIEIIDIIKQGYVDGLIFPGIIGFNAFEEALEKGEAWCLERVGEDYRYNSLDDLHKAMSWWACFNQEEADDNVFGPGGMDYPLTPAMGKSKKKEKAKSRKKRKQAKTSRKKNRR